MGTGVSQGTGTAAVVAAANTFLGTLNSTQTTETSTAGTTSTVRFTFTRANAIQWTNLPGNRQGLRLNTSTLTTAQLTAAENLMATALSASGKLTQDEIRRADDVLNANGYGSGLYSIAILGTPSTTSPWMLQIAGHHLAYNITYNGTYVSGSPAFIGVEPPNWVVTSSGSVLVNGSITASTSGTQHAPVETQRVAAYNLAQALQASSTFASGALLSGTYNDVVAGANGNSDSNFGSLAYPTTGRGLLYSSLDTSTQALVRAMIEAYVNTQPSDRASTLLGVYESSSQLASTYVGYAKGQGGTADFGPFPSGTSSQRSYIRVDGPRVWIEFVVQQGVLYSSQVHYHSIWRDKVADYGGQFGNGSSNFSGT
ncbi:DUF3500 domain-containing protein [Sphingomonas carotinifaciens]|uniref:DUF3500 domain-containing protein n=1 Tax=Sphingomonas carotinifaciens TaxID=1166323 RepID=A0A6N8LXF9_9SPHN|nr:DUF3500 domain-containing protein [Sphingomonas carotinifaciens]MBB4087537.1 hypothetical protein [Sphingomonas carotinifaciens]MWC45623.1 DUF3500 domain-containing protein [Sphingomonas carotinifaciens]